MTTYSFILANFGLHNSSILNEEATEIIAKVSNSTGFAAQVAQTCMNSRRISAKQAEIIAQAADKLGINVAERQMPTLRFGKRTVVAPASVVTERISVVPAGLGEVTLTWCDDADTLTVAANDYLVTYDEDDSYDYKYGFKLLFEKYGI
jgi:hypothetical protein